MKTKLYLEARGTASQATGLWTHSFSLKLIYYLLSYLSQSQQDRLVQRCLSPGLMTYGRVLGCRQVEGKNILPQLTSTDMPWHACTPTHIKIIYIYIPLKLPTGLSHTAFPIKRILGSYHLVLPLRLTSCVAPMYTCTLINWLCFSLATIAYVAGV